ncbi:hypothetical protein C4556_01595, partial [Candidatus Parcubacteria bacterium]
MDFDVLRTFAASAPMDWIILGTLAVIFTLDGLRSGPGRAAAAALALPSAMLLNAFLPSAFFLGNYTAGLGTPVMQAVLFLVLFAALYMLIRRMDHSYASEGGQAVQAFLCGVATVAIFAVIWLQVPALAALWQFGPDVTTIFGAQY